MSKNVSWLPLLKTLLACSVLLHAIGAQAQPTADGALNQIRVQLTPRRHTVLSSEIAGKIATLDIREGQSFATGQVLASLDCRLHEARLAKARAQSEEAERVQAANAQLDKLGSVSVLELEVAVARLAAAKAEEALMSAIVDRCEVRAPFAGKVAARRAQPYQYVAEGQELLEILDDGELEVEMLVPSRWLGWLETGLAFSVRIDETGREYPARLERIGAAVDAVSQSLKIFGRVRGAFPELRAGMSGTAVLEGP